MDIILLVPLVVLALVILLLAARAALAKGANAATADGLTLLAVAIIVGVPALGRIFSLDFR